MEIKKINLDRELLDSAYIESKQNFKEVLCHSSLSKQSLWKSPLFYGAMGLSSATIAVMLSMDVPERKLSDQGSINNSELSLLKNDYDFNAFNSEN